MLKDKNGKEVSLKDTIDYLTGTDDLDMAKSVIDFSVYPVKEDKMVGEPQYYLAAAEAIVTQISFMGPFVMIEVDFRNVGVAILQQVMEVVNKFHSDINYDNLLLVSTITSLDKNATHLMSLVNPLVCVRGYSDTAEGTTILQMIYSADNVGFSTYDIDFDKMDADIEREYQELNAVEVTEEEVSAAQDTLDGNNEEMKDMFTPEFGFRTPESKKKDMEENIKVSGKRAVKVHSRGNDGVLDSDNTKIKNVHNVDE